MCVGAAGSEGRLCLSRALSEGLKCGQPVRTGEIRDGGSLVARALWCHLVSPLLPGERGGTREVQICDVRGKCSCLQTERLWVSCGVLTGSVGSQTSGPSSPGPWPGHPSPAITWCETGHTQWRRQQNGGTSPEDFPSPSAWQFFASSTRPCTGLLGS